MWSWVNIAFFVEEKWNYDLIYFNNYYLNCQCTIRSPIGTSLIWVHDYLIQNEFGCTGHHWDKKCFWMYWKQGTESKSLCVYIYTLLCLLMAVFLLRGWHCILFWWEQVGPAWPRQPDWCSPQPSTGKTSVSHLAPTVDPGNADFIWIHTFTDYQYFCSVLVSARIKTLSYECPPGIGFSILLSPVLLSLYQLQPRFPILTW